MGVPGGRSHVHGTPKVVLHDVPAFAVLVPLLLLQGDVLLVHTAVQLYGIRTGTARTCATIRPAG